VDFTITIVTRNRADDLADCLRAIAAQDYPAEAYEVIVADNGSTDDTRERAEEMAGAFANFDYIYDSRPGQLVGWHLALQKASGDITCFIDDDVRPSPTWLSGLAASFEDQNVGLATGPISLEFTRDRPDWLDHMTLGEPGGLTLPFLGLLDCGPAPREIPSNFVWGSNFSARRSLLTDVGGFHPCAMPGELIHFYGDGEIYPARSIASHGYTALYHPEAAVRHLVPPERLTLEAVSKKFETTGYARSFQTLRQSGVAYPDPTDSEISDIAERYFRNWEAAPPELKEAVTAGLSHGIRTHLQHFKDDPDFRRWVLRENYLDLDSCYDHPDLVAYQEKAGGPETDWRQGT